MASTPDFPEAAVVSSCTGAEPGPSSKSCGSSHDDLPECAKIEGRAAAVAVAAAVPSSEALPTLRQASLGVNEADLEKAVGVYDEPLPQRGASSSKRSLSTRTATVSVLGTTVNISSAILGAGTMALPYAFQQLGWFSIVAMLVMGSLTAYTAVLLGRCASTVLGMSSEKGCQAADWMSISHAVFGRVGQVVVTTILTGEVFFILLSYLVLNGSALQILLPSCSRALLIRFSGCASLALTFCPPEFLSYFSALGPVAVGLVVALLAATGVALPEMPAAASYDLLRPASTSLAMGSFLFCFLCHCAIPSMYATMERKARFPQAVGAAFGVSTAICVAIGALGYYYFAGSLQQAMLDNVGRDLALAPLPGLRWMQVLGSGALALRLQTSFPLFAAPIVDVGERLLENLDMAEQMPRTLRVLLRFSLLGVVTALAELLQDHSSACVALTGSLFATCTALVFPALFYHSLHRQEVSRAQALLLGAIGLCGVYFMVTGTYAAVWEIAAGA